MHFEIGYHPHCLELLPNISLHAPCDEPMPDGYEMPTGYQICLGWLVFTFCIVFDHPDLTQ